MLSSTVESRLVFEMLMEDLASLGTGHGHHYELRAIRLADGAATLQEAAQPSDFIVRAVQFGVPQRRHRVIIVGIRSDLAARAVSASVAVSGATRTVEETVGNMPPCAAASAARPMPQQRGKGRLQDSRSFSRRFRRAMRTVPCSPNSARLWNC